MSKGTLDRTTFETIEAYVLDRMSVSERAAFEVRMASDPALRAELELERENIQAVELGGITRMLKALSDEGRRQAPTNEKSWGRYMSYAASVAVLLSVAIWWFARPPLPERLFVEHFTPEPGLPVTMGATDDPAFSDAMVYYKEGRYAEAYARWSPLLKLEPTNDTLLFYTASAAMADGDVAIAKPSMSIVAASNSVFQSKARWYLFLAHVQQGEWTEARELRMEEDSVYGLRAMKILSHSER
jgi:hypothetical protein